MKPHTTLKKSSTFVKLVAVGDVDPVADMMFFRLCTMFMPLWTSPAVEGAVLAAAPPERTVPIEVRACSTCRGLFVLVAAPVPVLPERPFKFQI